MIFTFKTFRELSPNPFDTRIYVELLVLVRKYRLCKSVTDITEEGETACLICIYTCIFDWAVDIYMRISLKKMHGCVTQVKNLGDIYIVKPTRRRTYP